MVIKGPATITFDDGDTFDVHVIFTATRDIAGVVAHGRFWSRDALAMAAKKRRATLRRAEQAVRIHILNARSDGMGIIVSYGDS